MGSEGHTQISVLSQVLYWIISPASDLRDNLRSGIVDHCYPLEKSPQKKNSACIYKGLCRFGWGGKTYSRHFWRHGMTWDSKLSNTKSKLSSNVLLPASDCGCDILAHCVPFLLPGLPSVMLYISLNFKPGSSSWLFLGIWLQGKGRQTIQGLNLLSYSISLHDLVVQQSLT